MKLYILTNSEGHYGQRYYPWESINVAKLVSFLKEYYSVEQATFEDVANGMIDIESSIVIYSSSQQSEYKQYIEDVLLFLSQKENVLIPSINMFKSHENKGYQELHKRLAGVESIPALYLGHFRDVARQAWDFPCVAKKLDGFGSGGVGLVHSNVEVEKAMCSDEVLLRRGFMRRTIGRLIRPIRSVLFQKKMLSTNDYGNYFDFFRRIVLQQFLPNMQYDYKVLIFSEKYYVLKRYVPSGNFRASGSGLFKFEAAPDSLLDYARVLFEKFDVPFISMDICFDGSGYHLIEFQGVHFGPYTLLDSDGYYTIPEDDWVYREESSYLEKEMAQSILSFIKRSKLAG
jgi:hypothetical protein